MSWSQNIKIFLVIASILGFLSQLYANADGNDLDLIEDTRTGELQIVLSATENICYGGTGQIMVTITQGVPPYSFNWSNSQTTQNIYNLTPNTYTVTVTDDDGNEVVESATITEMSYLGAHVTAQVTEITCHNGSTGRIVTNIQSGTGPYSYVWSNGESTSFINNLSADAYSFTVTDSYGCQYDSIITLDQPAPMYVTIFTEDATCFGVNDGLAYAQVVGGQPLDEPVNGSYYNFNWPNGVQNDTINYHGGNHMMSVVDGNNCQVEVPFTINQPEEIIATEVEDVQICIGGEVVLSSQVTGGTPNYDYLWVNQTTEDTSYSSTWIFSDLETTSNFTFFAEDENGCRSNVVEATVNVYPPISILNVGLSDADRRICPGEVITVNITLDGGNGGPYEIYNVTDNQVVPSPFTIAPEITTSYQIRVSDVCQTPAKFINFDIEVLPEPLIAFNSDKRSDCPGNAFTFNEFSPDIGQSYLWQFGDNDVAYVKNPIHVYENEGVYDVSLTVTSADGCVKTKTNEDFIEINPQPSAEFYVNSNRVSILKPLIEFTDASFGADSVYWFFGDGDSTTYSNFSPWHEFDAIGVFDVKQVAENVFGCSDTAYKKIRVVDEFSFVAPTAFTPNNDGVNDCFRPCGHGVDVYEYKLMIYDRFGSLRFKTDVFSNDLDCEACGEGAWDGSYQGNYIKGDELCPPGVYTWYAVYKDAAGIENYASGSVTLIR